MIHSMTWLYPSNRANRFIFVSVGAGTSSCSKLLQNPTCEAANWEHSLIQAVELSGVVLDTWDIIQIDYGLTWNSVVEKYQFPVTGSSRDLLMGSRSLEKHKWVGPAEMMGCTTGGLLPDEVDIDL